MIPFQHPLVNNNTSHEQAANILKVVWTAQNTIKEHLWQDQIDEDNRECVDCQVAFCSNIPEFLGCQQDQTSRFSSVILKFFSWTLHMY